MKRKLFIILSTLVLIITLIFSFAFKDNKENNKEISKVEKILSKPEGIQAYTLNGEKTNKEFNDLINNYVLDKITCKNETIATYNKATNEVSLSNIHMPDYCTMNFRYTMYGKLLADNTTIKTRTDFSTTYTETNIGTLFKSTESIAGGSPETVYYFSGDAENNWVKFGRWEEDKILYYGVFDISSGESIKYSNTLEECKASLYSSDYTCNKFIIAKKGDPMYWRIIRTNHDSSIRLIYHGTSPYGNNSFIGTSAFSNYTGDPLYAGYMYGTSGSLENNRLNTNSSVIKLFLENWYSNNLNSYSRYISKNAVYCGNRTLAGGNTYSLNSFFHYLSSGKQHNNQAYYDCESLQDSFSAKGAGIGNSQLEKPIGLITYDELVFAGARYGGTMDKGYIFLNAKNETSVYDRAWLTMSPQFYDTNHTAIFYLNSRKQFLGLLSGSDLRENESNQAVRPVISIKSDTLWSSGDGSPEKPYEIVYN